MCGCLTQDNSSTDSGLTVWREVDESLSYELEVCHLLKEPLCMYP